MTTCCTPVFANVFQSSNHVWSLLKLAGPEANPGVNPGANQPSSVFPLVNLCYSVIVWFAWAHCFEISTHRHLPNAPPAHNPSKWTDRPGLLWATCAKQIHMWRRSRAKNKTLCKFHLSGMHFVRITSAQVHKNSGTHAAMNVAKNR